MNKQQIKEGNKLIAEFMGYKYYHPGVDVDYSECGGLYDRVEVFSKIPIEVNEYTESNQCYFKGLPNPDYKNENSKKWRSNVEFLNWDTLNSESFKTELKYNSDWNELMSVCKKIKNSYFDKRSDIFSGLENMDIKETYTAVLSFLKFFNDPNQEKYIWNNTPICVRNFFIKNKHKIKA